MDDYIYNYRLLSALLDDNEIKAISYPLLTELGLKEVEVFDYHFRKGRQYKRIGNVAYALNVVSPTDLETVIIRVHEYD